MSSRLERVYRKGLITPPKFLISNMHYEVQMGSVAYGVSNDNSDMDVYGFAIPPKHIVFPHHDGVIFGFDKNFPKFDQFQQHHIKDDKIEYDFSIYNIVKFFRLVSDNNPNMLDALFVPRRCVLYSSEIGEMVRERRKIFLHKGSFHKLKGYAYSQLHKMKTKKPEVGSRRYEQVKKDGYDCYLDDETEFLTEEGWKKFDDVSPDSKVATINTETKLVEFQKPLATIDKQYTGKLYTLEPYMSRCVVTENHNMLISTAHRGKRGLKYEDDDSDWSLIPFNELLNDNKRSWFHIMVGAAFREEEYDIDDDYLLLAGLYVSEGSMSFRKNKAGKSIKVARLSQTEKGKNKFFEEVRKLSNKYNIKEYTCPKETVWDIEKSIAKYLYDDFGHGCKYGLRLPSWCFKLSHRQASLFWKGLFLGDGSNTPNGNVVYTSNKNLADDYQAMMVSSGHVCSIRGPFFIESGFCEKGVSYQVYLSKESKYKCIDFNKGSRFKSIDSKKDPKKGNTIKESRVKGSRVVCFEVENGTLITRSNGKPSFQGNCKFAYHIVRLINQAEQILMEGDLDLERSREQLKSIRRGEWTKEQITEYFERKEKQLEETYHKSDAIPHSPNEQEIKKLLVDCLEQHYGSLSNLVKKDDSVYEEALRGIENIVSKTIR